MNTSQISEPEGPQVNRELLSKVEEQPRLLHALPDAAITPASCTRHVSSETHTLGEAELEQELILSGSVKGREDTCLTDSHDMVCNFRSCFLFTF